jgi:hypothetical protein
LASVPARREGGAMGNRCGPEIPDTLPKFLEVGGVVRFKTAARATVGCGLPRPLVASRHLRFW